jgi:predicted amidohydrolase
MKIAIFQMNIEWQEPEKNMDAVRNWLQNIGNDIDIVVLPEMFNTGFSMTPEVDAEDMNGATVKWLISVAKLYGVAVVTSVAIRDKGGYFNRMMFVTPEGHIQWYDKRHLFRMGEENQHYMSGDKRVIVNYKGCRFLLQVCYDLRFPVWSRNRNDYDAIIYVANWPEVRNAAWEILLKARAVENSCFVIGANRTGKDLKVNYVGNSMIINYKGDVISTNTFDYVVADIDLNKQYLFREKFPVHLDCDEFRLV